MSVLGEHTATQVSRICAFEDDEDVLQVTKHTSQYQEDGPVFTEFCVEIIEDWDARTIMLTEGQMDQLVEDIDALSATEDATDFDILKDVVNTPAFLEKIENVYHGVSKFNNPLRDNVMKMGECLGARHGLYHQVINGSQLVLRLHPHMNAGPRVTVDMNTGQGLHPDTVMARQGARYIVQIFEAPNEQAVDTTGPRDANRQQSENDMLRRVQISVNS